MIGEKLTGRYELMEELGRTATSTLYKARDLDEQKNVAVRLLNEAFTYDRAIADAFIQRTSAIQKIANRKYVADVYSSGSSGGKVFVVREYIEGESLREKLDKIGGKLSLEQTKEIVLMICEGLHAAHSKGILHSGLNPNNVIIANDGVIKITDFGTSTIAILPRIDESAIPSEFLPILRYAAPEQFAEDKNEDKRTDIYLLGVLLHEMLMGEAPFSGSSFGEYKTGHCEGPVPPQPEVLRKALEKNPEGRFQEARDLETVLDGSTALPPLLHISPDRIDLGKVEKGKPCTVKFSISNRGAGSLKGTITKDPSVPTTMEITPDTFELDAPTHSAESDSGLFLKGIEVQVKIDTSELSKGQHRLHVVVATELCKREIPIRLQCMEPGEEPLDADVPSVNPARLNFGRIGKQGRKKRKLRISGSATRETSWRFHTSAVEGLEIEGAEAETSGSYLLTLPPGGPAELSVVLDRSHLEIGVFQAEIQCICDNQLVSAVHVTARVGSTSVVPLFSTVLQSATAFVKSLLRLRAFKGVVVAAFIGFIAWMGYGLIHREILKKDACAHATRLMGEGEYVKAKAVLDEVLGSSADIRRLKQLLNTPLSAKIELVLPQGKHEGDDPAHVPSFGDYRFEIELSAEGYLYLFQLDSHGSLAMLFPNPQYYHVGNPLAGGKTYTLPPKESPAEAGQKTESNIWFRLDGNAGEETIFLVASIMPATDLERLFLQWTRSGNEKERTQFLKELRKKLNLRTKEAALGIQCLEYKEIRFIHE
jgi:serine/threonine protein kinase